MRAWFDDHTYLVEVHYYSKSGLTGSPLAFVTLYSPGMGEWKHFVYMEEMKIR